MVMGNLEQKTELAVIGAGPAGYHAAIRAAQLGLKPMLIEKEFFGGVCLNHGCIPSKALIHAVTIKDKALKAKEFGLNFELTKVDFKALMNWKNNVVLRLRNGLNSLFKSHGIQTIKGSAFFKSSNEIEVQTQEGILRIFAEKSIIATGSKTKELEGFEFDGRQIIDSRTALSLDKIPESLAIIGAGYIGVELALFYAMLGTKVKLIELNEIILHSMPEKASIELQKTLKKYDVEFFLKSKALKTEKKEDKIKIMLSGNGKEDIIEAEKLLVAIGVIPNTKNLGLENTKVTLNDKGFIEVNEFMQTNDKSIYAAGDVTGKTMLAHKAFTEGIIAAENAAGKKSANINIAIPSVVYVKPEIALVGLTENEALKQGFKILKGEIPLRVLGKSLAEQAEEGFIQVIAEEKSHQILGFLIVGEQASNIISEATLAIEAALTLEDICNIMHPHPSFSEALKEACDDALGKAIHIYKAEKNAGK